MALQFPSAPLLSAQCFTPAKESLKKNPEG